VVDCLYLSFESWLAWKETILFCLLRLAFQHSSEHQFVPLKLVAAELEPTAAVAVAERTVAVAERTVAVAERTVAVAGAE
jgi:hypothetical protein